MNLLNSITSYWDLTPKTMQNLEKYLRMFTKDDEKFVLYVRDNYFWIVEHSKVIRFENGPVLSRSAEPKRFNQVVSCKDNIGRHDHSYEVYTLRMLLKIFECKTGELGFGEFKNTFEIELPIVRDGERLIHTVKLEKTMMVCIADMITRCGLSKKYSMTMDKTGKVEMRTGVSNCHDGIWYPENTGTTLLVVSNETMQTFDASWSIATATGTQWITLFGGEQETVDIPESHEEPKADKNLYTIDQVFFGMDVIDKANEEGLQLTQLIEMLQALEAKSNEE